MAQTREIPVEDGTSEIPRLEDTPQIRAQSGVGRAVARNTVIVMVAFVLSRVLGLVRDIIIAHVFGTSDQLGLYYAAFRIPDTIFLLTIGGVVGSAFIPVFSALRQQGRLEASWLLSSTLINSSMIIIALAGLLAAWFAPALVGHVIAPALTLPQQEKTVELTRIVLLSPLFLGLGGWAQGILNAENRFALSAFAPIFYNLGIILGALLLTPFIGINGLAWGVIVGSFFHFTSQIPGLARVGMQYSLRLNLRDPGVGEVARLIGPRLIGQFAFQANFIIITALATIIGASAVAAINYAYGLLMLPFGVFALSLSTVIFPTLTAQYARGNIGQLSSTLWSGVRTLIFISAACAGGLLALRYQIIALLYQHGDFTAQSTELVAAPLLWFSLGLISYSVVEVLTRTFYAMHDTRTPVVVAVCTVLLNGLFAVLLLGPLGHGGLALSLAASTTCELALLLYFLRRRLASVPSEAGEERATLQSALKSIAAAVLMTIVLLGLNALLGNWGAGNLITQALRVAFSIALGGAVYLSAAWLLGSREISTAMKLVRRR